MSKKEGSDSEHGDYTPIEVGSQTTIASKTIRLISMNEVMRQTSLSRTAINNFRQSGNFPKAVAIGEKRIAFVEAEVQRWIAARIADRDARK